MKQMSLQERRNIIDDFLNRWPIEKIETISLIDYNQLKSKDSFCYWLEHLTNDIGSIKGMPQTIKFNIYNHRDASGKVRMKNLHDRNYAWRAVFGGNSKDAFQSIKNEIITIVKNASNGNFTGIDNLNFTSFSKWKIAFLYSGERLIPIFNWEILKEIAGNFGHTVNDKTPASTIHEIIMSNKPIESDVFQYAYDLLKEFGHIKDGRNEPILGRKKRPVLSKGIGNQRRSGALSYLSTQKHNLLQLKLHAELIKKYGAQNVVLEEDNIDIQVNHPNGSLIFYEIKSNPYASGCIKEALGQLLGYSFNKSNLGNINFVIVGQYPLFPNERMFLNYVQHNIKMPIDYIYVSLI